MMRRLAVTLTLVALVLAVTVSTASATGRPRHYRVPTCHTYARIKMGTHPAHWPTCGTAWWIR